MVTWFGDGNNPEVSGNQSEPVRNRYLVTISKRAEQAVRLVCKRGTGRLYGQKNATQKNVTPIFLRSIFLPYKVFVLL